MIQALRKATQPFHHALEKKMYSSKIMSKEISQQELIHLLRINYLFFKHIQEYRAFLPSLENFYPTRHDLAQADLKNMDVFCEDEVDTSLFSEVNKDHLVGMIYVSLGSSLGSALIAKKLNLTKHLEGCSYTFFSNSPSIMTTWNNYLSYLHIEQALLCEERVIEGAIASFKYFDQLYDSTKV